MLCKRLLPILFLLLVACSTKSGQKASDASELFGNPELNQPLTEITFEEPVAENPDAALTDETTDDTETLPCDQISILSQELDEAVAGDEYRFPFNIQSNCQQVRCSLVAAPEWVELNGCELNGIPASHEALGEHELRVRVFGHDHETTFEERTFTLTVRDEPKINLFISSSDGAGAMKVPNNNQQNKGDFDVTLGQHYFYAWVLGYAEDYNVMIDHNDQLSLTDKGNNLYSIALLNEVETSLKGVTITAEDEHGNSVSKTFNARFLRDPCRSSLGMEVVNVLKLDGQSYDNRLSELTLNNIDVELGTKYRILFKVWGGKGPYEWRYSSKIVPEESLERTEGPRRRGDQRRGGEEPYDPLTTNSNWEEILPGDSRWNEFDNPPDISEEEKEQKVYFELETTFSFPGKDLPTVWGNGHPVKDYLKVKVETSACRTENNEPKKTEYDLYHNFQLPYEGPGNITCEQEIKDVWDTDASEMRIIFKCGNHPCGAASYYINECEGEANEHNCEDPKRANADIDPMAWVDDIDGVDIFFRDHTLDEDYWDDDYDEVDYDLESFTCYTPFRSIDYEDVDDRFNDNLVHSTWRDIVDVDPYEGGAYINTATYPLFILPSADHGIWTLKTRPTYPSQN